MDLRGKSPIIYQRALNVHLTPSIRLRATKGGTGFPTGINTASTFSRRLMRARGVALGEEFRGKGVRFVRAPVDRLVILIAFISLGFTLGLQWISCVSF